VIYVGAHNFLRLLGTTCEEQLMVFIVAQTLVGIGRVVMTIMRVSVLCEFSLKWPFLPKSQSVLEATVFEVALF